MDVIESSEKVILNVSKYFTVANMSFTHPQKCCFQHDTQCSQSLIVMSCIAVEGKVYTLPAKQLILVLYLYRCKKKSILHPFHCERRKIEQRFPHDIKQYICSEAEACLSQKLQ